MTAHEEKAQTGNKTAAHKAYWRASIRLTTVLLTIWFISSFGAGILFRDFLDQFHIGGAPLGFWFAQQGAIYVFVALIFYYCRAMAKLEQQYGISTAESED